MPDYRRLYIPGGTYFFTLVTHERRPLFADEHARQLLHDAIESCRKRRPFDLVAIVLLPDHLHMILKLPTGDTDYPTRIAQFKGHFSHHWLKTGGAEADMTPSKQNARRRGVWQRRYWEHAIRDEDDLTNHIDYIHFNPVKHGHVRRPYDWPWSSFHRYVKMGAYPAAWWSEKSPDDAPPAFAPIASHAE